MSTYSASELLRLWARQEVTVEQTMGHLLQNLLAVTQALAELEKRLRRLEQQLADKR
ncbi:MAG: hypothetical protein R3C14_54955 [Caldilineaceae bacterium]